MADDTSARDMVPTDPPYAPDRILEVLENHLVRYVLIGGLAAVVHGAPYPTYDVDVTPDPEPDNLERLTTALTWLDARIQAGTSGHSGEPVEFPASAELLSRAETWYLATRFGALDLVFKPAGTGGYRDLRRDAKHLELTNSLTVWVTSLADIVRSKEAAGRGKDRRALPDLRALLERAERRP